MDARGPLCVGIDPHAGPAGRLGPERRRRRAGALHPHRGRGAGRTGSPCSSRSPRSSNASAPAASPSWSGPSPNPATRGRWSSWTPSAATSAPPCPPTPTPSWTRPRPLFSDALTVSPYSGFGSLRPAIERARTSGCGLFVLALTSNPEGAEVQHAVRDGRAQRRRHRAGHLAAENEGAEPLGSFGAVVGATLGGTLRALDVEPRHQRPAARPRDRGAGRDGGGSAARSSAPRWATSCRASAGECSGTARRPGPARGRRRGSGASGRGSWRHRGSTGDGV